MLASWTVRGLDLPIVGDVPRPLWVVVRIADIEVDDVTFDGTVAWTPGAARAGGAG